MSFLDLAAWATHRRSEMADRINVLVGKCDHALCHINNIKVQAQGFVDQLNCEPKDLKERFLNGMKQLDEYIYLVTEINLSFANIEIESVSSQPEYKPVKDAQNTPLLVPQPGLLDILSEPAPSTSIQVPCPMKMKKKKPKSLKNPEELIQFSSSSQESFQELTAHEGSEAAAAVGGEPPVEGLKSLQITTDFPGPGDKWNLPQQRVLEADVVHRGCVVLHVDGGALWVDADGVDDLHRMMVDMKDFYINLHDGAALSRRELADATYCAFRDDKDGDYYRCLFLQFAEEHDDIAQVFLVDTGEALYAQLDALRPLARRFYERPPFARLCHLAAVDIIEDPRSPGGGGGLARHEVFLQNYKGRLCELIVDDNTSESLGVYISLPGGQLLNQLMVDHGLAEAVERTSADSAPLTWGRLSSSPPAAPAVGPPPPAAAPPEMFPESDLELGEMPEHEDPVEAVTGYHNRDEMDICKHYRGGADRTCFKGARCTKRHVRKHPGGWTMDRVPVLVGGGAAPLPAPGASPRAVVSCVEHFDCVWLQFHSDRVEEPRGSFGVELPPASLQGLVRDMNRSNSRTAHRPFKLAPSPGELVAALYPLDGNWYRAIVLSLQHYEQIVEVQYVDYGNKMMVKESEIRQLDMVYTILPHQAVRCKLAGVAARSELPEEWAAAKHELEKMVRDKAIRALIVSRGYDELTVDLLDEQDRSVGARLAAAGLVRLEPFTVVTTEPRRAVVVP